MKNFKIIAIIESKVERWFEDADINTAITILEKCSNEKERMNNSVKFMQLKKPLAYYIPPTDDERKRWNCVQSLVDRIDKISKYYEDDELRIFVKKQRELWDEGYNEEDEVYEGSKWGKYLRAPKVFFTILDKGKDKFTRLDKIGVVRYPIKTGINRFFYVTREIIKNFSIGKEFLIPVVKTPKEFKAVLLNTKDLETSLFSCTMSKKELARLNKKGALQYITWGEKQVTKPRQKTQGGVPWTEVPSVQGRKYWWAIPGIVTADAFCNRFFDTRFFFGFSTNRVIEDQTFYGITYNSRLKPLKVVQNAILNSTLTSLFVEIHGRTTLGQGVLQYAKYEMGRLTILNATEVPGTLKERLKKVFVKFSKREILPIFEEIGANSPEEVSLDKVKPDRRELDKIIMGEILGLTEDEQLEVYRAVIDLVKSRIEKAKSVPKKVKKVKGLDVEALVNDVISEVGKLKRFPEDFISLEGINYKEISIPKGRAEVGQDLYGFYVEIEKEKIRCDSPYEARYIQYSSLNGKTIVKIPEDESLILRAVTEYKPIVEEALKRINEYLESTIPDNKLRDKLKDEVWLRITGQK